MDNKLLREYVELEARFKNLESDRQILREKIVTSFRKQKIGKVADPVLGSFTVGQRVTYRYSEAVKKLSERLKLQKVKEEQKGVAKVEKETEFLLYTPPKAE